MLGSPLKQSRNSKSLKQLLVQWSVQSNCLIKRCTSGIQYPPTHPFSNATSTKCNGWVPTPSWVSLEYLSVTLIHFPPNYGRFELSFPRHFTPYKLYEFCHDLFWTDSGLTIGY
uniref:Uncharacterized protein n=1 Tax=Arundo donax TaxID=35708 RepID=A0A0A9AZH2_ARUDO